MPRVVSFADGFTSASAPDVAGGVQETYALNNNQTLTNITGLVFDNAEYKTAFFDYELERIGSSTYRQSGTFIISYNGSWTLTLGNYQGDSIIESTLLNAWSITLVINSSTGQFQYSSGNLSGHTESNLKLNIVRILA